MLQLSSINLYDAVDTTEFYLKPRVDTFSGLLVVGIIFCIVLISLARIRQRNIFAVLGQTTMSFKSYQEQYNEGIREQSFTALILLVNYFIATDLSLYWLNKSFFSELTWQTFLVFLSPILILIYQIITVWFVGTVTGAKNTSNELIQITLNLTQSAGIILLVILLFAIFKTGQQELVTTIFGGVFLTFGIIRIVKGFYISLQQGIRWYYIILYLWTLEILPIVVLLSLISKGEIGNIV